MWGHSPQPPGSYAYGAPHCQASTVVRPAAGEGSDQTSKAYIFAFFKPKTSSRAMQCHAGHMVFEVSSNADGSSQT